MKKYLLLLVPFFLSGCPIGDKINLHSAQAEVMNGKLCIFIDQKDIVKNENILNVRIWKGGENKYVYDKSYAMNPIPLEAGKCVPGISDFDFVPGVTYSIIVETPLYPYETNFVFVKNGDEIRLER
ncbi:putative T6SS immunity periplasmic lipoprotein [Enterobacillus tribolii]|uniref:DUF7480 domain-containing protein n=1 Tax=Enterobacillus tribolii TaxID=1487935 RepID=A0A370QNH1_9GAMM|nr:putative T6SS immunity periplasmic lipoprotein [Enterobacillus tribolii]MBW7982055.1 hypothetical protein [Enterobacillus tribolii]RDK89924.1 hypothetical protein C8D90_106130 [Enterobacillus tribolii]